jgi:hypothetical protein
MESKSMPLAIIALAVMAAGLYWWLALPRLRKFAWWDALTARLWAIAGNSRTLAVAYAAELLGILDEAKIVDWSTLLGVERGGRVVAVMGAVMFGLRLVTRTAVSFEPEA